MCSSEVELLRQVFLTQRTRLRRIFFSPLKPDSGGLKHPHGYGQPTPARNVTLPQEMAGVPYDQGLLTIVFPLIWPY